jgi:hypothetical protein
MANILGFTFKKNKTKARSQMCLIITDDKRIVDREIPVRIGCCVDDNLCSGWLLDGSNQMQNEETGDWCQILSERSTTPVCINNKCTVVDDDKTTKAPSLAKLVDSLFHESWVNDLVTMARDNRDEKNKGWVILIFGITIVLALLIISAKAFHIGG